MRPLHSGCLLRRIQGSFADRSAKIILRSKGRNLGGSILLVDEGTSALDQKNADIVEQSLLSNPNLTLILVSHHLSPERKAQFDRVFALECAVPAALDAASM